MGKTYRKEQPYKKARDEAGHKKVDHDHERTDARRQLQKAKTRWTEDDEDGDD